MTLTNDMIARINEIAEDVRYEYEVVAIRIQDVEFALGSINHVSHVWDNGEDTGEELNGISAVTVSNIKNINCEYYGRHVAVIGGSRYEHGEDIGEVVIEDAEVIEIIA